MDPDFGKYDVISAVEGANGFDIVQAVGSAAEESFRAIGNLLGGETGVEIANTTIDGIDYAAKSAAEAAKHVLGGSLFDFVDW